MRQQTLAGNGFERFRKRTRRETFLLEMDQIIPWRDLCKVIKPFYPKVKRKGAGRPAVGLERMLRIHFLQHWFNLSDPAVEEALYDSRAMRSFVGIDLGREPAPDETTVCNLYIIVQVRTNKQCRTVSFAEHSAKLPDRPSLCLSRRLAKCLEMVAILPPFLQPQQLASFAPANLRSAPANDCFHCGRHCLDRTVVWESTIWLRTRW